VEIRNGLRGKVTRRQHKANRAEQLRYSVASYLSLDLSIHVSFVSDELWKRSQEHEIAQNRARRLSHSICSGRVEVVVDVRG